MRTRSSLFLALPSVPPFERARCRFLSYLCLSVFICGSLSCSDDPQVEVVLYTSVDQPIAAKVVAAFEKQSNIKVRLVTDTEATKSVGLAEKLRAEKSNPIAHVWWGNEVFHTIALADEGHFKPLDGAVLNEIEPSFKDDQNRWAGCGLRVRVLAVGDGAGQIGGSIQDLIDPRFKGKIALARPLAGTTGGHVAALYALWGAERADDFFRKLRGNGALVLGGNSEVAQQVGNGNVLVGLTDNDDVFNAQRHGGELWQVTPDQREGQAGTLAIPTTVALVKRDDAPPQAKALADFLLADANERRLMDEHFVAASVRATPESVRVMKVRYADAAKLMQSAPKRAADILDGRTN